MLDYKLCKALKDAGFPQDFSLGQDFYAPNGEMFYAKVHFKEWLAEDLDHYGVKDISEFARCPSSNELRKACQQKFDRQLTRGISAWWLDRHAEDLYGFEQGQWDDMARLWIALQLEA